MAMDTGDQRPARLSSMTTRPPEPEHLPCPRCDSTNTKFCYYNNYNLSQPRHFCKACRRYWTRGGTLRNVPVGGGSRRSSPATSSSSSHKRPRTNSSSSASNAATTTSASSSSDMTYEPIQANPFSMVSQIGSIPGSGPMTGSLMGCEVNLNEAVPEAANFSSLLATQVGGGYLPFGAGFGLGPGPGLHGGGFGLGMMDWPMEAVGQGNGGVGGGRGGNNGSGGEGASPGCNTWQIGGIDGGLGDGDCFGWPDLAISMPGKGLK